MISLARSKSYLCLLLNPVVVSSITCNTTLFCSVASPFDNGVLNRESAAELDNPRGLYLRIIIGKNFDKRRYHRANKPLDLNSLQQHIVKGSVQPDNPLLHLDDLDISLLQNLVTSWALSTHALLLELPPPQYLPLTDHCWTTIVPVGNPHMWSSFILLPQLFHKITLQLCQDCLRWCGNT